MSRRADLYRKAFEEIDQLRTELTKAQETITESANLVIGAATDGVKAQERIKELEARIAKFECSECGWHHTVDLPEILANRKRIKELEADIRCMVEKAAAKHLSGYRDQAAQITKHIERAEAAEAKVKAIVDALEIDHSAISLEAGQLSLIVKAVVKQAKQAEQYRKALKAINSGQVSLTVRDMAYIARQAIKKEDA